VKVPTTLARLGDVLDVRVERDGKRVTLTWRRPYWLCADTTLRRLWLVPAPRGRGEKLAGASLPADLKAAAKVHKRWSDFEPERAARAGVRLGEPRERGVAVSIGYRSDKWTGNAEDYEHAFESGRTRVRQLGDVYLISGGGITVTPAGVKG
jgi:hypothetical protein